MIGNDTYIAATRFGLGCRPSETDRIAGDPRGWLHAQLRSPHITHPSFASLPTTQAALAEAYMLKEKHKAAKAANMPAVSKKQGLKQYFINEMSARVMLAVSTQTPFYERLVAFWSNHFSVSAKKAFLLGVVGAYEREAIRPHVTGNFYDMLLAVTQHPAMLVYLDNVQSTGPGSMAGMRNNKGLNENLAREILELHTLGVNGGYTQQDVTSFAKVITGWTIGGANSDRPGMFDFMPRKHEPGTAVIMGKAYPDNGQEQGLAVLRDLAMHSATARHIAFKLARHFVADEPPQGAVDVLAQAFMQSRGNLLAVYDALIDIREAWDVVQSPKVKSTYDLVISALRLALGKQEDMPEYALRSLKFLGNMPFTANSPAGFADIAQDIAGPESLMRRVEWAQMTARHLEFVSAKELVELAINPAHGELTRKAVGAAQQDMQAIAILFGSPEFQRR